VPEKRKNVGEDATAKIVPQSSEPSPLIEEFPVVWGSSFRVQSGSRLSGQKLDAKIVSRAS